MTAEAIRFLTTMGGFAVIVFGGLGLVAGRFLSTGVAVLAGVLVALGVGLPLLSVPHVFDVFELGAGRGGGGFAGTAIVMALVAGSFLAGVVLTRLGLHVLRQSDAKAAASSQGK